MSKELHTQRVKDHRFDSAGTEKSHKVFAVVSGRFESCFYLQIVLRADNFLNGCPKCFESMAGVGKRERIPEKLPGWPKNAAIVFILGNIDTNINQMESPTFLKVR